MPVATSRIIEVLQDARRIVAHPGWWGQGQMCSKTPGRPGVCATGAVAVATGDLKPAVRTKDKLLFDVEVVDPDDWETGFVRSHEYVEAVIELGKTAARRNIKRLKKDGDSWSARYIEDQLRRDLYTSVAEGHVIGVNDGASGQEEVVSLFDTTIKRLKTKENKK